MISARAEWFILLDPNCIILLAGSFWVAEVSWAKVHWRIHGRSWPGVSQRAAMWSQGEFSYQSRIIFGQNDDSLKERITVFFGYFKANFSCDDCNTLKNRNIKICPYMFPQEFKRELYQKKIEIESLNHRFVCRLSPGSERPGSISPLCDFRQRWDSLESETVGRQVRVHYRNLQAPQCDVTQKLNLAHFWANG